MDTTVRVEGVPQGYEERAGLILRHEDRLRVLNWRRSVDVDRRLSLLKNCCAARHYFVGAGSEYGGNEAAADFSE